MFIQQVHGVMAILIKNVLLSEIKNHRGGKRFAAPPQLFRTRGNPNPGASSGDAGMGTIHHWNPLHPGMSPGKPSFGWETGAGWEWWWFIPISSLKLVWLFPCAAKKASRLLQGELRLRGASSRRVGSGFEQVQVISHHRH